MRRRLGIAMIVLLAANGCGTPPPDAVVASQSSPPSPPAWQLAPYPDLGPGSALRDVVAVDAKRAWAVGGEGFTPDNVGRAVILRWDGSTWSRDPLLLPGAKDPGQLALVDAASASDVWAVGSVSGSTPEDTVTRVLHNAGSGWREVPFPVGNTPSITLITGLAAAGDGQAWLIGNRLSDVVIQQWDGQRWLAHEPPPQCRPSGGSFAFCTFTGITAFAPDDIWVAGNAMWPGFMGPLLFHWDGKAWRPVDVGFNGTQNTLAAVDGPTTTDLWAVGNLFNSGQPFVIRGDGTQWTVVPGLADGRFEDLAMNADGRPWVVRNTVTPSAHLALYGADASWTDVESPRPQGTVGSSLAGITAAPGSATMFAVGHADLPTEPRTVTAYVIMYAPPVQT
jgi:hypothetical protein